MENKTNSEEQQYLNLVQKVLEKGIKKADRTAVGTVSIFGPQMRFDLSDDKIPVLTTKKIFWKAVAEELLWILRGSTDSSELKQRGVHIWDGNSSKEFLYKLNLDRQAGDCGPVYGFQLRHFGASYVNCSTDYSDQGVDQLKDVINTIQNNPTSRRILFSLWNPCDLKTMVLPPCHCLYQFYVDPTEKTLSCSLYQRSGDLGLGVPFNIASASLLTHIIAQICSLKAKQLVHTIGDAHIYLNHQKQLQRQLQRKPFCFPRLKIQNQLSLADLNDNQLSFKDFQLIDYQHHPAIKMKMAV